MKREFLTGLGLDATVVDQIMAENGKDIESLKAEVKVKDATLKDLTQKNLGYESKIKEFEALDVAKITQERDSYKTQYEAAVKDKDSAIESIKKDFALDNALSKYQFTSDFAKQGIKAKIAEKGLKFKDGSFEGLEEEIKTLQEAHKDAFKDTESSHNRPTFTSSIGQQNQEMTSEEFLRNKYANNPWFKPNQIPEGGQ